MAVAAENNVSPANEKQQPSVGRPGRYSHSFFTVFPRTLNVDLLYPSLLHPESNTIKMKPPVLLFAINPSIYSVRPAIDGAAAVWVVEPPRQEVVRQQEARELGRRQLLQREGSTAERKRGFCLAFLCFSTLSWLAQFVAEKVLLLLVKRDLRVLGVLCV